MHTQKIEAYLVDLNCIQNVEVNNFQYREVDKLLMT